MSVLLRLVDLYKRYYRWFIQDKCLSFCLFFMGVASLFQRTLTVSTVEITIFVNLESSILSISLYNCLYGIDYLHTANYLHVHMTRF